MRMRRHAAQKLFVDPPETSVPAQRLSDPHDAPRIVRERQTFELFVAAVDGTMKGICDGSELRSTYNDHTFCEEEGKED